MFNWRFRSSPLAMQNLAVTRSPARVFLALLSLTTFAISQSLYESISGNAEFVVLNRISHVELLLVILVFNLLPAICVAIVWRFISGWRAGAGDKFLSFSFLLLLTPFLFELHKHFLSRLLAFPHNTILVLLPLALAAWICFAFRKEFMQFLLVLSPVIVVFPALFLWHTWSEVSPPVTLQVSASAFEGKPTSADHPPIFILLLDELTRPALLNSHNQIDAQRFPHFAELARESTWFDNATANAEYTTRSIPVIVTGNYPNGNNPSDAAYPDNLFRLLAPDYSVTIHEAVTRFCSGSPYGCPDASRVERRGHLLEAILSLYLARVAPKSVVLRLQADDLKEQQQRFQEFLGEIAPPTSGSKPPFNFMHLELPHAPYLLNPDGSLHETTPNAFESWQAGDAEMLARIRQDYEKQIQFVDSLVGEFVARLKQAGLYDQSMIIVTADHGVSWNVNAPGRSLSAGSADLIFPVPLFIKLPGQTEGKVSGRDAQLLDIMPTVAAVAGVKIPWPVAGRDLFAPAARSREKVMFDSSNRRFAYPDNFAISQPTP